MGSEDSSMWNECHGGGVWYQVSGPIDGGSIVKFCSLVGSVVVGININIYDKIDKEESQILFLYSWDIFYGAEIFFMGIPSSSNSIL